MSMTKLSLMPGVERFVALDVMRGLVIVLMAIDHAAFVFSWSRLVTDSAFYWTAGNPLPSAQFVTRWITHLCAPTFVLLAGASLAISTEKRQIKGETQISIDRHILARGGLIVALELLWMSPVLLGPGKMLLQVLFAIGASLICMIALRRLPNHLLLIFGLTVMLLAEAFADGLAALGLTNIIPVAVLLTGGSFLEGRLLIAYPLLPWLAIMCVGWSLGRQLLVWANARDTVAPVRTLILWGVSALALFAIVRGINRYGNFHLYRDGVDWLQWLHLSKYPPSLTFSALELGIAALVLALFFYIVQRRSDFAPRLRLLGQTALFFYLIHVHAMVLVAWAFGFRRAFGVWSAYAGAAAVVAMLYPVCYWYRSYKSRHAEAWVKFV
jgi:uncharacterized membrane protein